jgi:hypothetical protein
LVIAQICQHNIYVYGVNIMYTVTLKTIIWLIVVGVLEEAEFYNITGLIHLVKDRIKHHHQKNQVRNSQVALPKKFICLFNK